MRLEGIPLLMGLLAAFFVLTFVVLLLVFLRVRRDSRGSAQASPKDGGSKTSPEQRRSGR